MERGWVSADAEAHSRRENLSPEIQGRGRLLYKNSPPGTDEFLTKEQTACSPPGAGRALDCVSPVAPDLATARGRSGLPHLEPPLLHLGGSWFCREERGLWDLFAGLGLNFHRLQRQGVERIQKTPEWGRPRREAPPFQSLHLLTFKMRLGRPFPVLF